MVKEIESTSLLIRNKSPESWFGVKYNMNIYRGCQHGCIYCDSRSECYRIDNFEEITIKKNAVELLKKELAVKKEKSIIGTGAMSDPYMPIEKEYRLTAKALEIIEQYAFGIHIVTKSDMIIRDIDLLRRINMKMRASAAITITAIDDKMALITEPGAPETSKRLAALKTLSENGIVAGAAMMPILPFINDSEENIMGIAVSAYEAGVRFIIPGFGVTLRDRQRDYFYARLDEKFPGIKEKYMRKFGGSYGCSVQDREIIKKFYRYCREKGIITNMAEIANYGIKTIQGKLF
jgi:DNA repair photolyase